MPHRGVAKAFLILVLLGPAAHADEYPDFDLEIACQTRLSGTPGSTLRFPARVYLRTAPGKTDGSQGARAWSLSLAAGQGARIVAADASKGAGASAPVGHRRDDGYENTEITTGDGNEGVVSAVILSLTAPSPGEYLPGSGREALLDIVIESIVPVSGCAESVVDFVDGRKGSGQPVKNIITYGVDSASTRRDDAGPMDNDMDGYEPCRFSSCAGPYFLRGDVTGNLAVDLSDAVMVLDHLFRASPAPLCLRTADVDADGKVNVSDAIFLMNHLFLGGASPPPPYPRCGLATAPSTLPCDAAQFCP